MVVELIESECCPIEVEPDDHPKGYDYGKGYTFTWPPQPLLGFAVPEDAGDCTYTTTFDLDDPTVTYFVPDNKDSIEVFGTYTIVNDQGPPCPETVSDSLTVIKVEDSPEIDCCPIESEPSYDYGTDYNGEGFLYSFPADPGLWTPGDEADERCTYTVVIDDPEKLKPTRYYGPSTVTATYTITAREDPECSVTCDHSLVVELIEDECCPVTATDVTTYYSPEDTSGGDDRVYHTFMTNAQAACTSKS